MVFSVHRARDEVRKSRPWGKFLPLSNICSLRGFQSDCRFLRAFYGTLTVTQNTTSVPHLVIELCPVCNREQQVCFCLPTWISRLKSKFYPVSSRIMWNNPEFRIARLCLDSIFTAWQVLFRICGMHPHLSKTRPRYLQVFSYLYTTCIIIGFLTMYGLYDAQEVTRAKVTSIGDLIQAVCVAQGGLIGIAVYIIFCFKSDVVLRTLGKIRQFELMYFRKKDFWSMTSCGVTGFVFLAGHSFYLVRRTVAGWDSSGIDPVVGSFFGNKTTAKVLTGCSVIPAVGIEVIQDSATLLIVTLAFSAALLIMRMRQTMTNDLSGSAETKLANKDSSVRHFPKLNRLLNNIASHLAILLLLTYTEFFLWLMYIVSIWKLSAGIVWVGFLAVTLTAACVSVIDQASTGKCGYAPTVSL